METKFKLGDKVYYRGYYNLDCEEGIITSVILSKKGNINYQMNHCENELFLEEHVSFNRKGLLISSYNEKIFHLRESIKYFEDKIKEIDETK